MKVKKHASIDTRNPHSDHSAYFRDFVAPQQTTSTSVKSSVKADPSDARSLRDDFLWPTRDE